MNVARPNVIDIERCGASAERALEARGLVVKAHAIWHLHSFNLLSFHTLRLPWGSDNRLIETRSNWTFSRDISVAYVTSICLICLSNRHADCYISVT